MNDLTVKAQVSHLVNTTGRSARDIAREVGCSKSFVEDVRALSGHRYSSPQDSGMVGDHDKHVLAVFRASAGRGFPLCVKRA
jgi:hypothetical protein